MADVENAKQKIKALVDKYERLRKDGKLSRFNEENTKAEFIEPLFEALGWDVRNTYHPDEVTREEKISKDRVDYSFRISGIPKFFLEAKAIKETLDNPKFVEQAINYSWHKGCTWAVLTDFQEVKVFNAEWRESEYSQSLIKDIPYSQFLSRFDELWLLSKESFQQGLLDKEAEKWGKKTKKTPVDKQLLADFTRLREILSKNISKNNQNKRLSQQELDTAAQRILDRLIFIRFCEDKGLEEKKLISNLREWESRGKGQLVGSIRQVYSYFDHLYDSKIFDKHDCDGLDIDNEVLHEIIEGLHYTKDKSISYDFSAIEADVLGNIYEQYLGHILKKTATSAKLTESQAKRKEHGVFYTPTHIVDYIVRNTLGKLLENRKTNVEKLRVLDPSCGSGSFLIKAFDVLNEYYQKYDKNYTQTTLDITNDDSVYTKKVRILHNHIFGVDLDKQAVEVAQLNLLLKITEKGRRLPLLQQNIKQGNSLIPVSLSVDDNTFNWKSEFPEIMDGGGFDVIIGNPPWLMAGYYKNNQIEYLHESYQSATGKFDLYYCFLELGLKLLSPIGIMGVIVPNKFFHTRAASSLRNLLVQSGTLYKVLDFGYEKVFGDATNYPCILLFDKKKHDKVIYAKVDAKLGIKEEFTVDLKSLEDNEWYFENKNEKHLFKKMESAAEPLEEIVARFGTGVQTGADRTYLLDKQETDSLSNVKDILKPIYRGRDVRRYSTTITKFVIFPYTIQNGEFSILDETEFRKYKKVYELLDSKRNDIGKRLWFGKSPLELSGKWYGLMYLDSHKSFSSPHILTPSLSDKSNFTLGTRNLFVTGTAGVTSIILKDIPENIRYVLGILNSNLISYYIVKHSPVFQGGYHKFSSNYLKKVPVIRINFKNHLQKTIHDSITELVDRQLSIHNRFGEIGDRRTDERARLEDETKKIDTEIDKLVFKLYGISEEEVKIIQDKIANKS